MKRILAVFILMLITSPVIASDWHILATNGPDGRRATVVIHIPVGENYNSAYPTPLLWSAALAEYIKTNNEDGTFSDYNSPLQSISAPELADIRAGYVLEKVIIVLFGKNDSNAQKLAAIQAAYTEQSTLLFDKLKVILKFWGSAGDIP